MEYELKNGTVVDDDTLEAMAAEWESGAWEGHVENVVVGVPKEAADDEMTVVSFRMPKTRVDAVDAAAARLGVSKSEFYRRAVDRELAAL